MRSVLVCMVPHWLRSQLADAEPAVSVICFKLPHELSQTLYGRRAAGLPAGAYWGAVADKDSGCGAVSDVPEANGAVAGACGNVVAVGMPPHHIHIRLMPCRMCHSTQVNLHCVPMWLWPQCRNVLQLTQQVMGTHCPVHSAG